MPGALFARDGDVALRTVEEADLDFLQANRNHPDVRGPLAAPGPRNRTQWTDVFEDGISSDDGYHFLVCDETDDPDAPTPVGVVALPHVPRADDVGMLMYWVAPAHQGNGYVTTGSELLLDFAFRERGFHKVYANVVVPNDPSVAVLEKLGFTREGYRPEEVYLDGEHVDAYRYGLLAREWLTDA